MTDEEYKQYHKTLIETVRAYSKKDKTKSPANSLTAQVIRWFEQQGGTARRVNTGGQYDKDLGKWRLSGMRRGFEDVDGTYPIYINGVKIGIKIAVEIKIGKDTLSEWQEERRREVLAAGGMYIVSKGLEQTIKEIHKSINALYKSISEGTTSNGLSAEGPVS